MFASHHFCHFLKYSGGEHNIENQLIFKSNPRFIFHDSRGFESGSVDETEKVKAVITERAASRELSTQLHIIWYCLPTDTNRPLLAADEQFFNNAAVGKGKPCLLLQYLRNSMVSSPRHSSNSETTVPRTKKRRLGSRKNALEMLTTDFVEPLKSTKFCPVQHLHLGNMQEADSTCNELMERTADALNNDALRLLFVSVQQNNIDLCISYAVER
ncbi:hypothetical protein B0H14DRAFT_2607542 [Mycena olivaceomarginata]|nr:hypothetical protein B0H14DRAFT_2607542 [Mycena olivaceomarginata]